MSDLLQMAEEIRLLKEAIRCAEDGLAESEGVSLTYYTWDDAAKALIQSVLDENHEAA
jgi:hypothetical protein